MTLSASAPRRDVVDQDRFQRGLKAVVCERALWDADLQPRSAAPAFRGWRASFIEIGLGGKENALLLASAMGVGEGEMSGLPSPRFAAMIFSTRYEGQHDADVLARAVAAAQAPKTRASTTYGSLSTTSGTSA
jgi:hypothetical protein